MGAGASITEASSAEEIAGKVVELGGAFESYASVIRDNGVNGELLKSYTAEHKADELMNDLDVTNKLHRKKLVLEVEKVFEGPKDEGLGDGGGVDITQDDKKKEVAGSGTEESASSLLAELLEIAAKIEPKSFSESVQVDQVNHIFISYRQATETQVATRLYNGTKAIVADRDFAVAGKKPKIFFDRKSLGDGEKWEEGFVHGILNSLILLPLISWEGEGNSGSVGQLMNLGLLENDHVDNVLLEWDLALVLLDLAAEKDAKQGSMPSLMRSIFPVLIGGTDERGFLPFPFKKLGMLPTVPSIETKKRLVQICVEHGIPITAEAINRSVRDVVSRIVENQGVKLEDLGKEEVAIEACAERIFDKGSQVLLDVGLQSSPSKPTMEGCGASTPVLASAVAPPPLPSAPSIPLAVAEAQDNLAACKVRLSRSFETATTDRVDLGKLSFGAPFSVECVVDVNNVASAKMYAHLWDFEDVVCFTNGGTKENRSTGTYRVKINNDNRFAADAGTGFLKDSHRMHLVFTCAADGTRRLYGDGVEADSASRQGEKYIVPFRERKIKAGQQGSDWIQYHSFSLYDGELSAAAVTQLATKHSSSDKS